MKTYAIVCAASRYSSVEIVTYFYEANNHNEALGFGYKLVYKQFPMQDGWVSHSVSAHCPEEIGYVRSLDNVKVTRCH